MRKLALAFTLVALLALPLVGHAADLQAGSYVKLGEVALFGFDPSTGRDFGIDWNFTSPLGASGPFVVTQPDPLWPQRMVSVPNTTLGVPAGTAVYLYGQPEAVLPAAATRLDVECETNYDASQMLVELYVQHSDGHAELLWTETRSGHHTGGGNVLWPWQTISPTDAIYLRVATVPEPSSWLALALPIVGLPWVRRRAAR